MQQLLNTSTARAVEIKASDPAEIGHMFMDATVQLKANAHPLRSATYV